MRDFLAAVVQMRAVPDLERSVALARELTARSLESQAELVVLPENYCGIGPPTMKLDWAFDPEHPQRSPAVAPLCELSADSSAVIVLGGIPERHSADRVHNTLLVLCRGMIVARYRKVHLFDFDPDGGDRLCESDHVAPGSELVVVRCALGSIGLSICYDLRFPELYRSLAGAGAEIIVVPSAFTAETGAAHWETLVRARAIENQAWVLAAAQHGSHMPGRTSFGHGMIVDPWGTVVAQASPGDGVVFARVRTRVLREVRRRLPALDHRVLAAETSARVVPLGEGDVSS